MPGLQRYREVGCSFFQSGGIRGNLPKNIKTIFLHEIYLRHREDFEDFKIKGCTEVVTGCDLLDL